MSNTNIVRTPGIACLAGSTYPYGIAGEHLIFHTQLYHLQYGMRQVVHSEGYRAATGALKAPVAGRDWLPASFLYFSQEREIWNYIGNVPNGCFLTQSSSPSYWINFLL
jgi:hypothetical protein